MAQEHLLWVDCDPGHDDLMAIVLAALHPGSSLLGVSTVDGNTTLQHTTRNALDILFEIGHQHIPVIPGSDRPIFRKNFNAAQVHGANGLAGADLLHSPVKECEGNFIQEITKRILAAPKQVDLIITGPMTNLAILFLAKSEFYKNVAQISIMGGSIGRGNITPAAEFNILVDPEAASISLQRCKQLGIKLTMVPLDVTHEVKADAPVLKQIKQLGFSFADKVHDLIRCFQEMYFKHQGFEYPPIHDPCAVMAVLRPDLFVIRGSKVSIECRSSESDGRTNITYHGIKEEEVNCHVATDIKVGQFWEIMIKALKDSKKD